MKYMFENKGKWLKESDETNIDDELLSTDELDLVQPDEINEADRETYTDDKGVERYVGNHKAVDKTTKSEPQKKQEPAEKNDKPNDKAINKILANSVRKFEDIPDRNKEPHNTWRKANEKDKRSYDFAVTNLFSNAKPEDWEAYTYVNSLVNSGLDGMFIDWVKDHCTDTPAMSSTLAELDKQLQSKDAQKARRAYTNLWKENQRARQVADLEYDLNEQKDKIAKASHSGNAKRHQAAVDKYHKLQQKYNELAKPAKKYDKVDDAYSDFQEDINAVFDKANKEGKKVSASKVIKDIKEKYYRSFPSIDDQEQLDKMGDYFKQLFTGR